MTLRATHDVATTSDVRGYFRIHRHVRSRLVGCVCSQPVHCLSILVGPTAQRTPLPRVVFTTGGNIHYLVSHTEERLPLQGFHEEVPPHDLRRTGLDPKRIRCQAILDKKYLMFMRKIIVPIKETVPQVTMYPLYRSLVVPHMNRMASALSQA